MEFKHSLYLYNSQTNLLIRFKKLKYFNEVIDWYVQKTALQIAIEKENNKIVELLKSHPTVNLAAKEWISFMIKWSFTVKFNVITNLLNEYQIIKLI